MNDEEKPEEEKPQSARPPRRVDPESERQKKPWITLKVSRRTFYRQKRKGKL